MAQETENTNKSNKLCVLIIEEKSDLRTFFMGVLTKTGNYEFKMRPLQWKRLKL